MQSELNSNHKELQGRDNDADALRGLSLAGSGLVPSSDSGSIT